MWLLVSLPIGQHILPPDWSSQGDSWLVKLWQKISHPQTFKLKSEKKKNLITGEPSHWLTGWLILAPARVTPDWLNFDIKYLSPLASKSKSDRDVWWLECLHSSHSSLKRNSNNCLKKFCRPKSAPLLLYRTVLYWFFFLVQTGIHGTTVTLFSVTARQHRRPARSPSSPAGPAVWPSQERGWTRLQ